MQPYGLKVMCAPLSIASVLVLGVGAGGIGGATSMTPSTSFHVVWLSSALTCFISQPVL